MQKRRHLNSAMPIIVEAFDGTFHAHPPGTPQTDIERYIWKYENGQDLPEFAFSSKYRKARADAGRQVYRPPQAESTGRRGRNNSRTVVRVTAARSGNDDEDIQWRQLGEGALKLIGGGASAVVGGGMSTSGIGAVRGVPMALFGLGDAVQGATMMNDAWHGRKSDGYNPGKEGVRYLGSQIGMSPEWSDTLYNTASLGATINGAFGKVPVVVDPRVTGINRTKPIFGVKVHRLDNGVALGNRVLDSNAGRALIGGSVALKANEVRKDWPKR